eukprot:TRINITY_DN7115_c0_g1_i1.p2 TRINITY_DN7115_c0_g1~~TRINITY_DN7115_c0_g1_i1.p2  ORF type:complete len:244 (+),score=60.02 TRINITY_DN7115_c0_g1_i1:88-819(+)
MAEVQPNYERMEDQRSDFVKNATREVRLGFVRKVYGIVLAQLLLTMAIAAPFQMIPKERLYSLAWLLPASMFMTIAMTCVMACAPCATKTYPTNYIVLFLFTVSEAILVGFCAAMYSKVVVFMALMVTTMIFVSMTIYAFTTKTDFTGAGPYLFGALCALCIAGFMLTIMDMTGMHVTLLHKLYSAASVLLFTFYIVFDTQMIIGGGHQYSFEIDEYVFAAINLYTDIINLFLQLLALFGDDR